MRNKNFIKIMIAVFAILAGSFGMSADPEVGASVTLASVGIVATTKKRKFQSFEQFLAEKKITGEQFNEKSSEDQASLLKENQDANEAYMKELEEKVDNGISKEELEEMKADMKTTHERQIKALQEAATEQGKAIKQLLEDMKGPKLSESEEKQIHDFISENKDKIKQIKEQGSGIVEFTVNKAVAGIRTSSATIPSAIPAINGVLQAAPGQANLRGAFVDNLVTTFSTNLPSYPYTDTEPKEGGYGWVAEGASKPQIDFVIKTRYAAPVKVAAHMVLTEESVEDIPGLQSLATGFLRQKHDLKRQDGILAGTGASNDPTGAFVYASAYGGSIPATVVDPNFMDVVNALITDIYTSHNYVDEMPYMANLVMVHPYTFFTELVAAKDANGLPLYPMASLFQQVTIGGATIIPYEHASLAAGDVFVADMSKYMVANYKPYTVRIGWINDQMITNEFTMVGESRLFAFVKTLDQVAFRKDTIATVKAAIALP